MKNAIGVGTLRDRGRERRVRADFGPIPTLIWDATSGDLEPLLTNAAQNTNERDAPKTDMAARSGPRTG